MTTVWAKVDKLVEEINQEWNFWKSVNVCNNCETSFNDDEANIIVDVEWRVYLVCPSCNSSNFE